MALTDMSVFNSFMYSAATETIQQQVDLFNAATNGAIVLRSGDAVGDFDFEAMFKQISGLVGNRDAYGSGAKTPVNLQHLQHASVKVGGQTEVVQFEPQQFKWIQRNPEEAGIAFGEQAAQGIFQYMLNSGLASAVAAIGNVAGLNFDGTASTATFKSLNKGAALFGDRASRVNVWVLHSKSWHDLADNALTNTERLFTFGDVQVMTDGMGRPLIMTDSPALFFDNGGTDNYRQLGLTTGGIVLEDNQNYEVHMDIDIKQENTQRTMKGEFDFNIGLKGYTWDTASGGKSPTDAELATGTNWDQVVTDAKDTAGVMVTTL